MSKSYLQTELGHRFGHSCKKCQARGKRSRPTMIMRPVPGTSMAEAVTIPRKLNDLPFQNWTLPCNLILFIEYWYTANGRLTLTHQETT